MKEIFLGNFPDGKGGTNLVERRETVIADERKGRVIARRTLLLGGDPTAVIVSGSFKIRDGVTTRFYRSYSSSNGRDFETSEVIVRKMVKI